MAKKIQMMSHDKEWQIVDGQEVLVPVEQIDIDPITDSSAVQIEGHRTLEETLATKHQMTPEIDETKIMSKVGGVYHQNVVDGAYEEAILYGNSKVNLMEDDTTTALPIPLTFTSFNNGLQKELALGNNAVAPMLKGATLINRALTNSVTLASGEKFYIHNLKGNTIHTVSFKFTTKNTNAGVVIESCTGETYLENSMHKTGLGDNVIFTVTTHANADSIAIVNNATYGGETIQLDNIMVIEGDQTLMNLTFFKGMRSVELVKPLTNLFRDDLGVKVNNTTVTNSGGTVTVTSSSSSAWSAVNYYLNTSLKPNTKYLVMWDSVTKTHTSTANPEALISVYNSSDNTRLGYINNDTLCPTQRSLIFDTGNINPSNIVIRIHATMSNTETGTTTVKGLRVLEWDDTTSRALDLQGIGYFSGTKNVSIPNFKTNSKNLYPYGDINFTSEFADSWCDAKGNAHIAGGDIAGKSKARFLLRKGTYHLSSGSSSNISAIQIVDDKENLLFNPITIKQDTYCTLRVKTINANTSTTLTNIQIERGNTSTDYVAYDTRQYKPDNQEVVVLRSLPNGVCDTFNLQTGEYVQNIREVVLNGNNNQAWQIDGTNSETNISGFYMTNSNVVGFNISSTQYVICDKYNTISGLLHWKQRDKEGCIDNTGNIAFTISNSKLSEVSVNGFKEYLASNPITVQYQLAEPVIKQIPTVSRIYNSVSRVDFKEGKNASFRCFGNPTYLEVGSLSPVNPIVEPITNIPLNARLKANTSYTVRLDRTGSSLNVDLGGTTVSTSNSTDNEFIIKTPTGMLSHNQIRFSGNGRVGQVMVFEGDIRGIELPYFMGINNVKMPIVRNTGKNLVDFDRDKSNWWFQGGINQVVKGDGTGISYSILIPIAPLHYYTMSRSNGDRNFSVFLDEKYDTILWESNANTTELAPSNAKYLLWYLSSTGLTKDDNIMITASKEKNNTPTSYEPYRGNDICLVQGEIGLSQDMFEQGGISSYPSAGTVKTYDSCKQDNSLRIRSKALFKINGGSTYQIRFLDGDKRYQYYLWDASGNSLGITGAWSEIAKDQTQTINTPTEAKYMSLMFKKGNNTNISVAEVNLDSFQLLELDSTVQLRSLPNGVKDELNLLTGEYIQRVGEIVLDGSDDLTYNYESNSNDTTTMVHIPNLNKNRVFNFCNDKLIQRFVYDKTYIIEGIFSEWNGLYVRLLNTKLSSPNPDGVKQYLQQNPITVQYQLAEPIISYPHIVSNTQEREVGVRLPNGVCDTYNPSTGITVKRVGKVVLDGSEKWNRDGSSTKPTDLERFSTPIRNMVASPYNTGNFVVKTSGYNIVNNDKTSPRKLPNVWNYYQANIYLDFATTAFGMATDDSADTKIGKLKTYLSSNPITVYYELKNPIVTTDIVLPNGVHDEYNPITGLYTKKVEYIELDGGETNLNYRVHSNGYLLVDINGIKMTSLQTQPTNNILSNISVRSTDDIYNNTNITTTSVALHHQAKSLMVRVVDSSTTVTTADEYRQYLSKNPIKIWYELATPQKIQLTPYFGLPMPYAYKDGHLIMDSAYNGVSLPPEFKYKLVANRTGQVNQNNIKLQQHTTRLSNLEAMLVDATLQSMYEREMMAFNLEMVNINLINLEE